MERWAIRWSCDLMLYWNEKHYKRDHAARHVVVIWCSIEMRNTLLPSLYLLTQLWFDALLKWETLAPLAVVVDVRLWFDALLKWETLKQRLVVEAVGLWFDALLKWETLTRGASRARRGCDLMLYWNEKHSPLLRGFRPSRCDLMLYWNEKHYWAEIVLYCWAFQWILKAGKRKQAGPCLRPRSFFRKIPIDVALLAVAWLSFLRYVLCSQTVCL